MSAGYWVVPESKNTGFGTGLGTVEGSGATQVGDLAQLDESEAPKAGHARVYLVPLRADAASDAQHDGVTAAEDVLQVCEAAYYRPRGNSLFRLYLF